MPMPAIDIATLPLLDTAVGLFGSFAAEMATSKPSVFEATVTMMLVIYD